MGQGELFALTEDQVRGLLECQDDSLLMDLVNNIEENWQGRHHEFLGKEWNLVHCCLSDGTCNPEGGSYPLNRCILGGRHLLPPNDGYMAVLVMPSEVVDIAAALTKLDRDWLCRRYKLVFGEELSDDWLCDLFEAIKAFYHQVAEDRQAVLFTTDEHLDAVYKPKLS